MWKGRVNCKQTEVYHIQNLYFHIVLLLKYHMIVSFVNERSSFQLAVFHLHLIMACGGCSAFSIPKHSHTA